MNGANRTSRSSRARSMWLAATSVGALLALLAPATASAATCDFQGPGTDWHGANWSCPGVPGSADDVTIGAGDFVTVAAAAAAGSLSLTGGGSIRFSNDVTLAVSGAMSAAQGTLAGAGTVTVAGTFTKTTSSLFTVTNDGAGPSADLTLNGPGSISGGAMCIADSGDAHPDLPMLTINGTFTVADGAAADPFPCTAGPRIRVTPIGSLVKTASGVMSFGLGVDNDGLLTVQAGTLSLAGGTSGVTSDGDFVAAAGATLGLNNAISVGASGRVGGAGTVAVGGLNVSMAAGSTLDPAVLAIQGIGVLEINGTGSLTLPVLNLNGAGFIATLDSERTVTASALSVTSGAIRNDFTLTVPAGGSFSKTTSGPFLVTNSGAQGSADLVLDEDATLSGGSIQVAHNGSSPDDLPHLEINERFTIGAGADANAFPGSGTRIDVNGPDGHLLKAGSGTTSTDGAINVDGGTLTIGGGQAFATANGVSQTGGLTDIATAGALQGSATLTGGVLRGSGQVTGNVTNTSGTVAPGASPGRLTVTGSYVQGPGGRLLVEIAGTTPVTQFDQLVVTGAATLAGSLEVVTDPGFGPLISDEFEILTAASRTGGFTSLSGASIPGLTYQARNDPGGVTLVFTLGPPVNTGAPTIPGTATVGDQVSCSPGTWSGAPTFAFEWLRNGTAITGASAQAYGLIDADAGQQITCRVTATNQAGSPQAISNTLVPSGKPAALPTPPPVTPLPAAQAAPPEAKVKAAEVISLPSARRCVSRRNFRIRLRTPRGIKISSATVKVNGRQVDVVRGRRLKAPVDLRGLPQGRFTIEITVRTGAGVRLVSARRYRTCVPRKRS